MKYSNIELHKKIILEFLHYLNKETNRFILKGGTALYLCYGLDRFSEDIDLDSEKGNISNLVKNFCKFKRFSQPNEKKNTTHGQRFMIDYGVEDQLLKIETSHRDKIDKKAITKINNILVFKLDELIIKKCNAFFERDKIRDLYDVCYVVNKYWNKLLPSTKTIIKHILHSKGMNQYDLVEKQEDPLIDREKLMSLVVKAFEIIEHS